MAISWACALSVAEYAATGHRAPAARLSCPDCGEEMAFDGSYPRRVREAGVLHHIFIRRARCSGCGTGHALTHDFVLSRRKDSTTAVGAAVLAHSGHRSPDTAVGAAVQTIGATWRAASRRRPGAMPPAWPLANVIFGGQLLGTRVELSRPISHELIGHSRAA
jgi:hypothetical protein